MRKNSYARHLLRQPPLECESTPSEAFLAAKTGETIWRINGDKDTGRAIADNIYNGNRGAEFSGSRPANAVLDVNGTVIDNMPAPANNFLIYRDGDLEREILDGVDISKMTSATRISNIFSANGCSANNASKNVPCLSADIFGDWREELFVRTADNSAMFFTVYNRYCRLLLSKYGCLGGVSICLHYRSNYK